MTHFQNYFTLFPFIHFEILWSRTGCTKIQYILVLQSNWKNWFQTCVYWYSVIGIQYINNKITCKYPHSSAPQFPYTCSSSTSSPPHSLCVKPIKNITSFSFTFSFHCLALSLLYPSLDASNTYHNVLDCMEKIGHHLEYG